MICGHRWERLWNAVLRRRSHQATAIYHRCLGIPHIDESCSNEIGVRALSVCLVEPVLVIPYSNCSPRLLPRLGHLLAAYPPNQHLVTAKTDIQLQLQTTTVMVIADQQSIFSLRVTSQDTHYYEMATYSPIEFASMHCGSGNPSVWINYPRLVRYLAASKEKKQKQGENDYFTKHSAGILMWFKNYTLPLAQKMLETCEIYFNHSVDSVEFEISLKILQELHCVTLSACYKNVFKYYHQLITNIALAIAFLLHGSKIGMAASIVIIHAPNHGFRLPGFLSCIIFLASCLPQLDYPGKKKVKTVEFLKFEELRQFLENGDTGFTDQRYNESSDHFGQALKYSTQLLVPTIL